MKNHEILREVRVDLGLSLRRAAEVLGKTHVAYGRIERGDTLPHLSDAETLRFIYAFTDPQRERRRLRALGLRTRVAAIVDEADA